jgi:hypothetical protein
VQNFGRFAIAICALALVGCSLSSSISTESEDYNHTVEDVTNNILVTNILRAHDGAGLYFSDLSQIRGSLSLSGSIQASFPWGPWFRPSSGTGVRRSAQIGPVAVNTNPTFDIAPLNRKQFAQGILEPLSKTILAYYIQRGVDPSVIIRLFVSRIDEVQVEAGHISVVRSLNPYDDGCGEPAKGKPKCGFDTLLDLWAPPDWLPNAPSRDQPKVVVVAGTKNFGPPVSADAKAVVEAATAGLEAKSAGKQIQFTKKSAEITLCVPSDEPGKYSAVGIVPNSVVKTPEGEQVPSTDEACNPPVHHADKKAEVLKPKIRYQLALRSVEGIFYWLGGLPACAEPSDNQSGGPPIPFCIYGAPITNPRFSVEYRGKTYYISEKIEGKDYTTIILALLNDLLNINRDANEIPTTKAVQAVGGE